MEKCRQETEILSLENTDLSLINIGMPVGNQRFVTNERQFVANKPGPASKQPWSCHWITGPYHYSTVLLSLNNEIRNYIC
jgi:hypothetical protein